MIVAYVQLAFCIPVALIGSVRPEDQRQRVRMLFHIYGSSTSHRTNEQSERKKNRKKTPSSSEREEKEVRRERKIERKTNETQTVWIVMSQAC